MTYSMLERWYNLMHLSKTTPPQASDVRDLRRFVVCIKDVLSDKYNKV